MAPEEDLKKRIGRRLARRRREGRRATLEFPERLQNGDDADEDCTAPDGQNMFMNQSVFGMIAAAGSQVDFNARFDGQSSDDEDESEERKSEKDTPEKGPQRTPLPSSQGRRKLSESRLLRTIPTISRKWSREQRPTSTGATSPPPKPSLSTQQELPHETSQDALPPSPRLAPVMSQMLEARAELSQRPSFDSTRRSTEIADKEDPSSNTSASLAHKLMEIFNFEKPEEVIEG